jgi:hypothetical protein
MAGRMQRSRGVLRAPAWRSTLGTVVGLLLCSLGCGPEVRTTADGPASGAGGGAMTLCDPAGSLDATGVHFAIIDIEKPLLTQLQVYLAMVDHEGRLRARLSNADRTSICDGAPCPSGEGCSPNGCVEKSLKAGSLDEHPFFEPHPTPPYGYEVAFESCLLEEDAGAVLRSASFDLLVESPAITFAGTTIALFFVDPGQPLEGGGTIAAEELFLGTSSAGPLAGTIVSRRLEEQEVPDGVPQP